MKNIDAQKYASIVLEIFQHKNKVIIYLNMTFQISKYVQFIYMDKHIESEQLIKLGGQSWIQTVRISYVIHQSGILTN